MTFIAAIIISALPTFNARAESGSYFGIGSLFGWNATGQKASEPPAQNAPAPFLTLNSCDVATAALPIEVESTLPSGPTAYATLGAAFTAINAGTHQGVISVEVCFNSNEGTTPANLNSSGAGSALYTAVNIYPLADGLTISGNPVTGFGVIQLNGADNVTINGDNPNSAGTNRNLTVSNTTTNTVIANSAVRIATSTAVTTADNDTIKNLVLLGNVTSGNSSLITSTTGSSNSSFGIYAGGNGGATATGAPTAITSVTTNVAPTGTTINNLVIDNNSINQCARAIVFNGNAAAQSTGVTISNNTIGASGTPTPATPPYTSPATTVYTKGIWIAGTTAITISGNTLQNIMSYVGTAISAIELNAGIGAGTISISNNTINGVALNASGANSARGISVLQAGGPYTISGNAITNVLNFCNSTTITNQANGIFVNTSAASALIEKNKVSTVYNRNTGTFGVAGVFLNGGNNITFQNNFIWDVNQDMTGGSAFSTTFGVVGLRVAAGTGHKIYHNSINMFGSLLGTAASSHLTAAFAITATTLTGLDVRNNIFANTMTGGTTSIAHVSMFLPSGGTSAMNLTLNNNDYFSGADAARQGIAQVGTTAGTGFYLASNFNAGATTPATNLRNYTSTLSAAGTNDNASKVVDPVFTSNTDLHIQVTSPMESMGANLSVATDIDGDARGATPDIGADEISLVAPGTLQFSSATFTNPETSAATITVTRTAGLSGAVSVDYATVAGGSATGGASCGAGVDYITTSGTLMWANGDSASKTFNVTLCADGVFEPGETVNLALSNPTGGATLGTPNAATLTITDAGSTFSGSYDVGTGQTATSLTNPGGIFEAINGGTVSGNITINITSNLAGETGTVALNEFASGFTILIKPSAPGRTITGSNATGGLIKLNGADGVRIDGSSAASFAEDVVGGTPALREMTITNTGAGAIIWIATNATSGATGNTIRNCILAGPGSFSGQGIIAGSGTTFAGDAESGRPNSNNTIQNNQIKGVQNAAFISGNGTTPDQNWMITENDLGSATAAEKLSFRGLFISNSQSFTISQNRISGINSSTATSSTMSGIQIFGVINGGTINRNEIKDIRQNNTTGWGSNGIYLIATSTASNLTISNNFVSDIASQGFNGNEPADNGYGIVVEGTGGGYNIWHNTVVMNTNQVASGSITAALLIDDSATTAGAVNLQDNILGNTQTVGTQYSVYVDTGSSAVFSTINYNDYYTVENVGFLTSTRVTLANWQTATGQDANSKAVNPLFVTATDFHLQATSTLIDMGTSVGIADDYDGQTRPSGTAPEIGADEVIVAQPGTFQFNPTTYSPNEGDGTVTLTVTRTGGSDGAVDVSYTLADGTATGGASCMTAGVDYINTGGTVMFANGETSKTFTVTLCDDASVEGSEAFTVTLTGATNGGTIGANSTATVTITDNDVAPAGTIQFSSTTYTVGEGGGNATLTVTRTGGSNGTISATYSFADVTATGGANCGGAVDYDNDGGTVTFTNGDTENKTILVPICDDGAVEGSESFTASLSGAAVGSPSSATVTITDNDSPTISIDSPSVAETDAANTYIYFNVTLNTASTQTVSVNFQTTDGTATSSGVPPVQDYTSSSGTVTFMPGETMKQIQIPVWGDTVPEADETFTVTLSTPVNATILNGTGTGTILNDDTYPTVQFSSATYTTTESLTGGRQEFGITPGATITVTRTGNTSGTSSVNYATSDGTATGGASCGGAVDYKSTSGTLTFAATETSKTFFVETCFDTTPEANETVNLTLSMPVLATLGTPNTAVLTINDNDTPSNAIVQFDAANYEIDEGDDTVTITVTRSGNTTSAVSVNYATSNGTANGGSCQTVGYDYQTASGTLNFGSGETSKTFSFEICSDIQSENPPETVNLTLSMPSVGATLGTPNAATLRIIDAATQYRNPNPVFIPENPPLLTDNFVGQASSSVTVSGAGTSPFRVRVTLYGFTHPSPDDIDVLLVSPLGQKFVLVGDAGGTNAANNLTLTFEDAAATALPDSTALMSGNYKSANHEAVPDFFAPAPTGPYSLPGSTGTGATLNGTFSGNPNGTWTFYFRDDTANGNTGSLAGGVGLEFIAPTAASVTISGRVTRANGQGLGGVVVSLAGSSAGGRKYALTSPFGYYTFEGVTAGDVYVISATSKRYTFNPSSHVITVQEEVTDLNFVAEQ